MGSGGRQEGRPCLHEFGKRLKSKLLPKALKPHSTIFQTLKKIRTWTRKCGSKLWVSHKQPGALQELVQRPLVAVAPVGGAALALLAALVLVTLVQDEELVRGPEERWGKAAVSRRPQGPRWGLARKPGQGKGYKWKVTPGPCLPSRSVPPTRHLPPAFALFFL